MLGSNCSTGRNSAGYSPGAGRGPPWAAGAGPAAVCVVCVCVIPGPHLRLEGDGGECVWSVCVCSAWWNLGAHPSSASTPRGAMGGKYAGPPCRRELGDLSSLINGRMEVFGATRDCASQ